MINLSQYTDDEIQTQDCHLHRVEVDLLMNDFYFSHDYQWLQRQIMKTDEYAHF